MINTVLLAAEAADPGILPVVLMGVGIVIIVIICRLMLLFGSLGAKKREEPEKTAPESEEFKPDGELAAVIGAAVAEESGVDVKNIKIVSIKKV